MTLWFALDANSKKVIFQIFMNLTKKGCHHELPTMPKIEDVQAWEWHHIVACRLHLPAYMLSMSDGTTHQVSLASIQGDMWWQIGIDARIMPTELGINSKHELLWNIISFYGLNT